MRMKKKILACSLPIPMVGKLQKNIEKQSSSTGKGENKKTQIPEDFFKNYKFRGVQPVENIRSHLSYAAALMCLKECYLFEEYQLNYNKFLQSLTTIVGDLLSKTKVYDVVDNDVHFFVSNGYVVENLFDDTFDIAGRLGRTYSIFTVIMDCWKNEAIGDGWFVQVVEDFASRLPIQNFKRENFIKISPFQFTSLKIAIDFLEQLSLAGFECSSLFVDPVRRLKNLKTENLNLSSECTGLTDNDFFKMIQLMQNSCYNVEKHADDEELFELIPYVDELSVKMLNLTKEDRSFYEAAVRQIYFSTASVTLGAMNEYEDIMFNAMSFQYEDEMEEKYNASLKSKEDAYTSLFDQHKELKSRTKKLQKDFNALSKKISDGDNPEIERLTSRVNALKLQLDETSTKLEDTKKELAAKTNKDARFEARIKNLEDQLNSLKKENARLKSSLNESNDIIEDLNNDLENIHSFASPDEAFSEEDVALAKNCDFVFFVPTFVPTQKLEELFPNAKFIKASHNVSFDVGFASSKAIVCTKGLKHSAYWRIQVQCERSNIPIVPVTTYGVKTIFDIAVNEMKKS